jgi:hydroxyethylthiazole kinase
MNYGDKIVHLRDVMRSKRPLIHHITNFVVMHSTANGTIAIGASPVMAHSSDEVEEMTTAASALVLNIGTLTRNWVDAMILAGKKATERGIPVVLDPVGAGATTLRTNSAKRILDSVKVSVIRGNPAEVAALAGEKAAIRGVDSLSEADEVKHLAPRLADKLSSVVAISGKTDFISDGEGIIACENGDPLLRLVTGTGCLATTAIACFAAVSPDPLIASAGGLAYFGLAAEKAAARAKSPGSFEAALFDSLYDLTPEEIKKGVKLRYEKAV